MDPSLAIILGILQGLTEFFPVSSSGHLTLFGAWFGLEEPDITFDVLVHVATLVAILIYFRKDVAKLMAIVRGQQPEDMPRRAIFYLAISLLPAGFVGVFLKDHIHWVYGKPFWVGICLFVTGVTLMLGFKLGPRKQTLMDITLATVIVMGVVQALAILPGISRSGITIMAGLFMGLNRSDAARFSFLMAVPVIAGAAIVQGMEFFESAFPLTPERWTAYGLGFITALVSGLFALAFLMKLIEGNRFFAFGFYCFALGFAAFIF